MSDEIPFAAFSNDELGGLPKAKAGDAFRCGRCGQFHELKPGLTVDGRPSEAELLYFHCGGKAYLGGLGGHLIVKWTTDPDFTP